MNTIRKYAVMLLVGIVIISGMVGCGTTDTTSNTQDALEKEIVNGVMQCDKVFLLTTDKCTLGFAVVEEYDSGNKCIVHRYYDTGKKEGGHQNNFDYYVVVQIGGNPIDEYLNNSAEQNSYELSNGETMYIYGEKYEWNRGGIYNPDSNLITKLKAENGWDILNVPIDENVENLTSDYMEKTFDSNNETNNKTEYSSNSNDTDEAIEDLTDFSEYNLVVTDCYNFKVPYSWGGEFSWENISNSEGTYTVNVYMISDNEEGQALLFSILMLDVNDEYLDYVNDIGTIEVYGSTLELAWEYSGDRNCTDEEMDKYFAMQDMAEQIIDTLELTSGAWVDGEADVTSDSDYYNIEGNFSNDYYTISITPINDTEIAIEMDGEYMGTAQCEEDTGYSYYYIIIGDETKVGCLL
jgi:hypothetical protein